MGESGRVEKRIPVERPADFSTVLMNTSAPALNRPCSPPPTASASRSPLPLPLPLALASVEPEFDEVVSTALLTAFSPTPASPAAAPKLCSTPKPPQRIIDRVAVLCKPPPRIPLQRELQVGRSGGPKPYPSAVAVGVDCCGAIVLDDDARV